MPRNIVSNTSCNAPSCAIRITVPTGVWNRTLDVERVRAEAPARLSGPSSRSRCGVPDDATCRGRHWSNDPWRAIEDVVVGTKGTVRLTYSSPVLRGLPRPAPPHDGGAAELIDAVFVELSIRRTAPTRSVE